MGCDDRPCSGTERTKPSHSQSLANFVANLGISEARTKFLQFLPRPFAEMCRGFLYEFWRILMGVFLEDFSGQFSPQK